MDKQNTQEIIQKEHPHFDARTDGWIDIVRTDGSKDTVGFVDVIRDAHKIADLNITNPYYMTHLGTLTFLAVTLSDVYYPTSERDLEDEADRHCFDMDRVNAYLEKCVKEGVSYNIFDDKRPFLQCGLDAFEGKDLESVKRPVSVLTPVHPSGNNSIFFMKDLLKDGIAPQDQYRMSPKEYILHLLAKQVSTPMEGMGYCPSRFASFSPLYAIPKGETLFDTLLYMMPIFKEDDIRQIPFWRREYGYPKTHEIGFISDSFAPVQYIRWGEIDEDGYVTSIYKKNIKIEKGETSKHGRESLSSYPYFMSKQKKDGNTAIINVASGLDSYFDIVEALLPTSGTAEDAGSERTFGGYTLNLCRQRSYLSYKLQQSRQEDTGVTFILEGVRTNKTTLVNQVKMEVHLPANIQDREKQIAFRSYLDNVRKKKHAIFYAALAYYDIKKSEYDELSHRKKKPPVVKNVDSMVERLSRQYFNLEKDYYEDNIRKIETIENKGEDVYGEWLNNTTRQINLNAIEAYRSTVRKRAGHSINWEKGMEIMSGRKPVHEDKTRQAIRNQLTCVISVLNTLPKDELYTLKQAKGKDYGDDAYAEMVAGIVFERAYDKYGQDNPDFAYRVDEKHRLFYCSLLAEQVIKTKQNKDNPEYKDNEKNRIPFKDWLVMVCMESASGKQRVERILRTKDIWNSPEMKNLTRLLSTGQKKCNIGLPALCADLELWEGNDVRNPTPMIWATYIGKNIVNKEKETQNGKDED